MLVRVKLSIEMCSRIRKKFQVAQQDTSSSVEAKHTSFTHTVSHISVAPQYLRDDVYWLGIFLRKELRLERMSPPHGEPLAASVVVTG